MVSVFAERLEGERIVLVRTRPELGMAQVMFAAIDADREHLDMWLPWVKPTRNVEDSLKYLFDKEEEAQKGRKIEYGIYLDDQYLGNIAIFDIDEKNRSGEVGYWLISSHTGKGIMTEALRLIEKEAFGTLNLNRIVIRCDARNTASYGVAKRCGFTYEGTLRQDCFAERFGDMRDTMVFSKLRSDHHDA